MRVSPAGVAAYATDLTCRRHHRTFRRRRPRTGASRRRSGHRRYIVFPRDVAVDANDNVYIPDVFPCGIRKVDARAGIISTVAGNGVCAASGENVLATQSSIHELTFLTADADDLFFIEWNTMRVRRLHFADGTLSTFIGGGFDLPVNDEGAIAIAPNGDVYLRDYGNSRIHALNELVIGDGVTFRLRKLDRSGNLIRIGGKGSDFGPLQNNLPAGLRRRSSARTVRPSPRLQPRLPRRPTRPH